VDGDASTLATPQPVPLQELIGVRSADEAELARSVAYQAMRLILRIAAKYWRAMLPGGPRGPGSPSTEFLAVWLQLIADLVPLRDLLNELTPPPDVMSTCDGSD
jgi:hypothetical protein